MISLRGIEKIYNKNKENEFKALDDVSLEIEKGEMVAVVGTSGAGKSTLLHILACIDTADAGVYVLDGETVTDGRDSKLAKIRNEKIGIVMQDYALIEEYTALENVITPLDFAWKKKTDASERRKRALTALEQVGISELANKRVSRLSGGQKQRVAIARAIVNNPAVILADEPTGALDSHTAEDILKLLKELCKSGITIIMVTHDEKMAAYADRIIHIEDGKIL